MKCDYLFMYVSMVIKCSQVGCYSYIEFLTISQSSTSPDQNNDK